MYIKYLVFPLLLSIIGCNDNISNKINSQKSTNELSSLENVKDDSVVKDNSTKEDKHDIPTGSSTEKDDSKESDSKNTENKSKRIKISELVLNNESLQSISLIIEDENEFKELENKICTDKVHNVKKYNLDIDFDKDIMIDKAFYCCFNIQNVEISGKLTSLNEWFTSSSVKNVKIGGDISRISNSFNNVKLENVTFNVDTVIDIEDSFNENQESTNVSIDIPSRVRSIKKSFNNNNFKNISFKDNAVPLNIEESFNYLSYGNNNKPISNFPKRIERIVRSFSSLKINSLTLPYSIKEINESFVFSNIGNLKLEGILSNPKINIYESFQGSTVNSIDSNFFNSAMFCFDKLMHNCTINFQGEEDFRKHFNLNNKLLK